MDRRLKNNPEQLRTNLFTISNRFMAHLLQQLKKNAEQPLMVPIFVLLIPIVANMPEMGMAVLALYIEQLVRLTPIRWGHIRSKLTWKNPGIWLLLLFLMYCVGVMYSTNTDAGWKDIGMKASLALLPIYFICYPIRLDRKKFVRFFLYGAFLSIIINCSIVVVDAINYHHVDFYYFKGEQLSHLMHRGYWAVYLTIALFMLLNILLNDLYENKIKHIIFHLMGALVLLFFIVLTGSKMGIILAGIISLWTLKRVLQQIRWKWIPIGVMVVLLAGLFLLMQKDNGLTNRFQQMVTQTFQALERIDVHNPGSTGARRQTWDASWSLIKENPFFGVGTGDFKASLVARDKEKGYVEIAKAQLNSHNQLLNTQLTIGMLGTIFLLMAFIVNFKRVREDDFCLIRWGITALLFIALLTESMLETQAGIIPYSFLLCAIATSFLPLQRSQKGVEKISS